MSSSHSDSNSHHKKQKMSDGPTANTENCSNGVSDCAQNIKDASRNGHAISTITNGINPARDTVINPEMCYYCFDVLYSHLSKSPLKTPAFSNDQ